ncbi:hypothetical protein ACIRG4_12580 [Streptomyces sp. NPDC102395]|uniref:hypothetical protein n=1 Tax=Streptomyces sp. NPDC102395 TaxID=3366168 RepID=UPI00380D3AE4
MTSSTRQPLIGVVLAGLVSWLAQHSSGRAAERAEERRSARDCAEARRGERLARLVDFLSAAQEVERVAVDHYQHHVSDERWQERARQTVDRTWVSQKTIHMLCPTEVNEAARRLAYAVQNVLREGPDDPGEPQDEKIWAAVRPSRREFLDGVREHLH